MNVPTTQALLLAVGATCAVLGAAACTWQAGLIVAGALMLLAGVDLGRPS